MNKTCVLCLLALCFVAAQAACIKVISKPIVGPDDITFTAALQQHNLDKLRDHVLAVSDYTMPEYGKYWTSSQVLDLIAPSMYEQEYVLSELSNSSMKCQNYRDAIQCSGSLATVYKYFSMDSTNPDYTIPASLREHILFIDGLSNKAMPNSVTPMSNVRVFGDVDPGYVGREVLQRLYNITSVNNVTVGLGAIEYQGDSGFSQLDLEFSQRGNGQKSNTITPNHILGSNTFPDTETELDLQMQSQTADGATLWYDGSSQWLYTWAVNFFNTKDIPYVVSHSWGWAIDQQCTIVQCTNQTSAQYVNRVNAEYLKLAMRGVSMMVASGDSGAPGRSDSGCSGVNRTVVPVFPGSSPWVVSVGATFVVTGKEGNTSFKTPLCQHGACATGSTEATVNTANVSWTAGGGFSEYLTEGRPPWQASAVQSYLSKKLPMPTHYNPYGRAYPDVAVIGHNCPIWQGGLMAVDGTSCSSPTFSAIVALLNHHQLSRSPPRPRVGLVAPLLYAMYSSDKTIFNDITEGNNWCTESECCPTKPGGGSEYGYEATEGYDPVTGLGTPNVGKMMEWLDRHT